MADGAQIVLSKFIGGLLYMDGWWLDHGKVKVQSATQSVPNDINTEWTIPETFLGFLLYPWEFQTKQGFTPRNST